ncbi:MAG: FAD-dependent oxidoreductase, partial [Candidatus Thermoplasmatota archaeon]|nr:FAD-dependent oxidoreductase [Candidatus Thermoplasmatota archaeon]
KKVAVVGGGNAAVIEAIFLKQIGCADVFLIHRRNQLRAEQAYVDTANEHHIHVLYSTIVEAIGGDENVRYLDLLNTAENKKSRLDVDGVFISIGETPQNTLAQQMGVALDGNGFIITDKQQRTNVKGVYAAGDITGGLRQIITACAEGAIAALQATEVLGKQYPY